MKILNKKTYLILGGIAILELLSFLAYFSPALKLISALIVATAVFVFTFKDLESGLLILFAELIIGSKGHLFEIGPVSIRMIIFGAIILVYLIKLIKKEERLKITGYLKELKTGPYFIFLAFFVILSLFTAFIKGNNFGNIFSDFNAWPFFLLLFPILSVYFKAKEEVYTRLISVVTAAFLWLGIETLFILYIFTHNISVMTDLYLWLRRTGVAEITPTLGSWPRIFIQSQIYAAIALVTIPFISSVKNKAAWVLMILAWSVSLLSMSRSFWLAIIVALALGLLIQLIFNGWRKLWSKVFIIVLSALASILLILIIALFPIPKPSSFSANPFLNRVSLDSNEAAVASRWSLLPVLWQEILKSPLIGFGYGKTITYKSSDPRVLQISPSGQYTTYAFEWGYLALWLKLGILGLLAYLALFFTAIYQGIRKWREGDVLAGILALGLFILAIVNFFTPYLDHPLGIGYLVLAITLLESASTKKI